MKAIELKPAGKGYKVSAIGVEPIPPDSIVDGAIIDSAPSPTRFAGVFAAQPFKTQGRRRGALGQLGDRQEDHAAGDERAGAVRVDLLGSGTVHPLRHPGRQSRLPDHRRRHRPERRARWKCCWWRRRRTRSPTTPASSRRPAAAPVVVDVDAFALQNAYEANYGLDRRQRRRAAQRRRQRHQHQHPLGRPVGLHPRRLDGRQCLHRGGPERAQPAYDAAEELKRGQRVDDVQLRRGAAGAAGGDRQRAARNREDVRLLQGAPRRAITSTASC